MQTVPYATLDEIKTELKATGNVQADDDAYLLRAAYFVSGRIDAYFRGNVFFAPYTELRYYDGYGQHIEEYYNLVYLDRPLLEATEVKVSTTELTRDSDYYYYPRNANQTPKTALRIDEDQSLWAYSSGWYIGLSQDWQDAITVQGVWGWHTDYTNAWLGSGDMVGDDPLTANATTINVTDVDGSDDMGRTPRFSPGNLLKIDDEYVLVLGTDTTLNQLTVKRGMRGTTAAAHSVGTAIYTWQTDEIVKRAVLRWANYLYKRRGAFEQQQLGGDFVVTQFPPDMPGEVRNTLMSIPQWEGYATP